MPINFPLGGTYPAIVRERPGRLTGLVDMHTHPMSYLGFGSELIYGAPDGDPARVLSNCNAFHGGWGLFDNRQGNDFRRVLVDKSQEKGGVPGWDHKREGYPNFPAWPSWHDRTHQQMWVDWIRRAWEGGLRVCVALAVNNHTLADAAETKGPYDDLTTGDQQIHELIAFVSRHSDFMEIAYSAHQLRSIVMSGKLAVVIGVELDGIGNFYRPANQHHSGAFFNPEPSAEQVINEIDRLFNLGVRYVFPIHITDNVFGGAAVYESGFSLANRFTFGRHFEVEPAPAASDITFVHRKDAPPGIAVWATLGEDYTDFPPIPPTNTGHRNVRGLTALGEVAIRRLIQRGMIIDIDHMSERTVERVLAIAEETRHPLCAGHAGLRGGNSERFHTAATLRRLHALGGIWGIGLAGGLDTMTAAVRALRSQVGAANFSVAIGSDACGFEHLPRPRFPGSRLADAGSRRGAGMVVYRDNQGAPANALVRCRTGNRTWDYSAEGCMHFGLLPDMLEEAVTSQLMNADDLNDLFSAAEGFAQMWEKCESKATGVGYRLGHTTRHTSSWDRLIHIAPPAADLGAIVASAISPVGNEQHICIVTSKGLLLHCSRSSGNAQWSSWGDVSTQTGGPRRFTDVSCAEIGGLLHVCAVTADGSLLHTIRRPDSWDSLGDIKAQVRNAPEAFCRVSCTNLGGELYVCGITANGSMRDTIRTNNRGWLPMGDVERIAGDRGWIVAGSAASLGTETHVFAVNGHGKVFHGIRFGNGQWDGFKDVELERGAGDIGLVTDVAAAKVGNALQICCTTNNGGLFHTITQPRSWQRFGNVKDVVGISGFCTRVAVASVSGELQCLVISG